MDLGYPSPAVGVGDVMKVGNNWSRTNSWGQPRGKLYILTAMHIDRVIHIHIHIHMSIVKTHEMDNHTISTCILMDTFQHLG